MPPGREVSNLRFDQLSRSHLDWYLATHTVFHEIRKPFTPPEDVARRILQGATETLGSYNEMTSGAQWGEVQDWTFMVVQGILGDNVKFSPGIEGGDPTSWGEIRDQVRITSQTRYLQSKTLETVPPWSKRAISRVSWALVWLEPFHIWCIRERVRQDLHRRVDQEARSWVDGGSIPHGGSPRSSFEQALRGFSQRLDMILGDGHPGFTTQG